MALYLSIVLLAMLVALPTKNGVRSVQGGPVAHGLGLVELIWGTALGLALAHWFSFQLTARVFGGGKVTRRDVDTGVAQLAAAIGVAAFCTVPVFLFDETRDVQMAAFVPAAIVGAAGYAVGRTGGRSRQWSLVLGGVAAFLGLTVAGIKNLLLGH